MPIHKPTYMVPRSHIFVERRGHGPPCGLPEAGEAGLIVADCLPGRVPDAPRQEKGLNRGVEVQGRLILGTWGLFGYFPVPRFVARPCCIRVSGPCRTRTCNLGIKSPLHCQLC